MTKKDLIKINDYLWEIPKSFRSDMNVPARIYASEKMLEDIFSDRSLDQLVNVTTLPGIEKYAIAMPDAHEGYGFPIGGVAAFSTENGVISPGGIGYDINCGVRLLRSELAYEQIKPFLKELCKLIYNEVPSGVGVGGKLKLKGKKFDDVLEGGAPKIVEMGYGDKNDLENIESRGRLENADAYLVSETAKARGSNQLGTMGAGNHFVEIDFVEKIYDEHQAKNLGIFQNQTTLLIHTGSRGLGHQIASDYIKIMNRTMPKYGISIPDRELACAPFNSKEGQDYFKAMSAGANFAWANRQMITWETRQAWKKIFENENLKIVYDVAHNIAKLEPRNHAKLSAKLREKNKLPAFNKNESEMLLVHRKGATRAFPGQPVIIPGSMGTASYLLIGQEKSLSESFGSSCHGAGRKMSRMRARKQIKGLELKRNLEEQGMVINSGSLSGLAEEAPEAYKNIDEVIGVIDSAGIAKKICRLKPIAVVKG